MLEIASRSQLRMSFIRWALVCVPAVLLLGTLSGIVANSGYENAWFARLDKPGFMPPSWAFPVAWTILYIFLGLVLAMLIHARGARSRGLIVTLFIIQLLLNYSWSPTFFLLHQLEAALAIIVAMVLLTVVLIVLIAKVRPVGAWLLIAYLAWLGFATALTYSIWTLNPDAATIAPAPASTNIEIELD